MIIKVGDEIINTGKIPVTLIFKDKEEAAHIGNMIANIIDGDTEYPTENNGDWWFKTPPGWTREQVDLWSILTEEQKILLGKSTKNLGAPKFKL